MRDLTLLVEALLRPCLFFCFLSNMCLVPFHVPAPLIALVHVLCFWGVALVPEHLEVLRLDDGGLLRCASFTNHAKSARFQFLKTTHSRHAFVTPIVQDSM